MRFADPRSDIAGDVLLGKAVLAADPQGNGLSDAEVAKAMRAKDLPLPLIAELTGLSEGEIEALKGG